MSASRKHRKAATQYRMAETLRAAGKATAVVVGTDGSDDIVMKGTVMYIVPRPMFGMPKELVAAIVRRRKATLDGQCECGGRRHAGAGRPGRPVGTFLHEDSCIAHDRALAAIVLRTGWRWSA